MIWDCMVRWVWRVCRERGGGSYSLPEREEDNEFDSCDFQEGLVLRKVILELDIELD